jgi:hypothetical protein
MPLKTSEIYKGVKLPEGTIFYYDDFGEIRMAFLSENIVHEGIHFKNGQLYFHETGISCGTLNGEQMIDGIKYSNVVCFDLNGNVSRAFLVENTKIDGILYKGRKEINYYPSKKVKNGTVAERTNINGKIYEAGQSVLFNQNGTLM